MAEATEEEEKELVVENVIVPDVLNTEIGEAGKALTAIGLKYTTEYVDLTSESKVLDQFPLPGTEVQKGSIIDLYLNDKSEETIIMPSLIGKDKTEVIKILDEMNVNYELKGEGEAIRQNPAFGEQIKINTKIEVEFGGT